ncbi:MAG TPA: hypothetical protein VFO79_13150, partial [Xanthomonadales bacterium]|nr:hypothetical protein [Xanthomonadales bacterium]
MFAILLPGAALTFIAAFVAQHVRDYIPDDHLLQMLIDLKGPAMWAGFFVTSYIAGHIVASLGARLDPLYDERKAFHRNDTLKQDADRRLEVVLAKLPRPASAKQQPRFWFAKLVSSLLHRNAWGRVENQDQKQTSNAAEPTP